MSDHIEPGARPLRPLRRRGYYRALKRGEEWALKERDFQEGELRKAFKLYREWYAPIVKEVFEDYARSYKREK